MLTSEEYKIFGEKFLQDFLSEGFGAMSKMDIEILIYHLLADLSKIRDMSTKEISIQFQIPQTKVRALHLNSIMRYQPDTYKAILPSLAMK
mgnify:CR=1 FL=1